MAKAIEVSPTEPQNSIRKHLAITIGGQQIVLKRMVGRRHEPFLRMLLLLSRPIP